MTIKEKKLPETCGPGKDPKTGKFHTPALQVNLQHSSRNEQSGISLMTAFPFSCVLCGLAGRPLSKPAKGNSQRLLLKRLLSAARPPN